MMGRVVNCGGVERPLEVGGSLCCRAAEGICGENGFRDGIQFHVQRR